MDQKASKNQRREPGTRRLMSLKGWEEVHGEENIIADFADVSFVHRALQR